MPFIAFQQKVKTYEFNFLPVKKVHVKNFSDSQAVTFSTTGELSLFAVADGLYDLMWPYSDQKGQDL